MRGRHQTSRVRKTGTIHLKTDFFSQNTDYCVRNFYVTRVFLQEFIRCNLRLQNQTLSFAFSQRFSPFKPIIPFAYWEAYAVVKWRHNVFQRLYFCPRFLFKLIDRSSMTFRQTANGKRQKWNFCRLSSAVCTIKWKYLYLRWIVGDIFPFFLWFI